MSDTNGTTRPELIVIAGGQNELPSLEHLAANRRLIVKRSLLSTVVAGLVPIPVVDEYVAGRVKAGMLKRVAEMRQVDLATSSAELLADPREGTAIRNATITAASLIALKLAWRKFFALLAVGRRAEDMVSTFQLGTLFDHYCAKKHVGAGIDRAHAYELRGVIHAALAETERAALIGAFTDGARTLGRTVLEAPAWLSDRLQQAVQQWGQGRPPGSADADQAFAADEEQTRWLDRATAAVEQRMSEAGLGYLRALVSSFERRWQEAEAARREKEGAAAGPDPSGEEKPPT